MFIVIEGLDGAGKSTQVKKIREELSNRGIKSEYLHFPRFNAPIYGDLIARFLRGELGDLDNVNPYLVALIYAGDRAEASDMIKGWLSDGKVVIIDRYVYSNIAYQCAKCESKWERERLRDWIFDLEYGKNSIAKPDITLFLDVPFQFTQKSLEQNRIGEDRNYLNGSKDIHEASLTFQQKVREIYITQKELDPTFEIINCSDANSKMLSPEEIFRRISSFIIK